MTLLEMVNWIRFEAQIIGPDTFTGYIQNLINAILREYTGKLFYQELFMDHVALTNPGSSIQNWILPDDVQHWLPDQVYFSEGGSYDVARTLYSGPLGRVNSGPPFRYIRAGNVLRTWPYEGTTTSSLIWINYYRYPTLLDSDAEVFPIVSLEETVKKMAAARLARYAKTDRSKALKADGMESYNAANAQENRANEL